MTRVTGVLTPPQTTSISKGCDNCGKIRRQAEEAFSELRAQTDRHILAVQKKLKDDHNVEVGKFKAQIENLQQESKKLGSRKINEEIEKRVLEIRRECDARIQLIQNKLWEAEANLARKDERRDQLLRDARVSELEKENSNIRSEIDKLEIEVQSYKSKLERAKMDQEMYVERQTRTLAMERDEAKDRLVAIEQKLQSLESFKREAELERAKIDLNYRRRLGEMESEVRRTEIESVRLKREIIQLTQRLESSEQTGSTVNAFPMLSSARNRLLALEAAAPPPTVKATSQSGRIAKVSSPKRSPRAVEELPPPTPSAH